MLIYAYITISEAYLGSCQRSMTNNVFAKGSIKNISGSSEYEIWCFKIFRKSILHILESGMFRQKKLHHPCFLAEKIFAHVLISILNIKI